ncbi:MULTISPECIES: hypothetical protein [Flavobacterium]|uniref:hypothetical protein n=1 Tax=Flavobacterium TaxID=237 RepID=UPI001E533F4A|nr:MULTISPECIES: hypothetical protein [unclassified Flavobacterium]UFH46949.1 hypothetical protein LNP27_02630 [Flavobacterium sp. F-340]WKL43012.1 hypothetical protein Q1W72_11690 [Flavobacterium sp. ZE23DGlu08]
MKNIILIILFYILLTSCTKDEVQEEPIPKAICYRITSVGVDSRGNFITIEINSHIERYKVQNYMDYYQKRQICDLANLTKEPM